MFFNTTQFSNNMFQEKVGPVGLFDGWKRKASQGLGLDLGHVFSILSQ